MILINDQSIDSRLVDYQIKITNAWEDRKINPLMQLYGYGDERFGEGQALYEAVVNLHKIKKNEFAEQLSATETFQKEMDEMDRIYGKDVAVARVALKNHNPLLKRAALLGLRKTTFHGWAGQVTDFYTTALEDGVMITLLADFGLHSEKLEENKLKFEGVMNLKKIQVLEAGDAQEATKLRDDALDALDAWVADMVAIARVALADSPQLLEKLNIVVAS
ncbi:MAG: hypothetical protein GY950_24200 [bacterium]|nr:hypothetical protein [bacterium]